MVLIHFTFSNKKSLPNSLQLLLGIDILHVVGNVCSFNKFCIHNMLACSHVIATPLLEECEDDTHTLEMGTWESSGIPEILELDCSGQNISP